MVKIHEGLAPVRFKARDGQTWGSPEEVVRYHGRLDIQKALGDDLHNKSGGNRLTHGFTEKASVGDVAAMAETVRQVIAIRAEQAEIKAKLKTMPKDKNRRFESADGSLHWDLDGACREDIRLAVAEGVERLSTAVAWVISGGMIGDASRGVTPARVAAVWPLSEVLTAASVAQATKLAAALDAFGAELAAALAPDAPETDAAPGPRL